VTVDRRALEAHYVSGLERDRLVVAGVPRLELVRTLELLERFLPPPPADLLDVGGGAGAYSARLARSGHRVTLVDVLPAHVEEARAAAAAQPEHPFEARVGDARRLEQADSSFDAVLLMGPLYHLTERDDRIAALREARRVARPGARLVAVGISRFTSLLDGLTRGRLGEEAFRGIVERDLREGQHRNPEPERAEWFTTAFFHHPDELRAELEEAGLEVEAVLGIEGPGWLVEDRWAADPAERDHMLYAARAVEDEPSLAGLSAHLLAAATRP
jgi:ubiquinone/menaquinone biosynthesis C-methylase UbiE